MIGFIAPYTFTQFGTRDNYSAIVILHTFQPTVAHALGYSVLTSRILAMDLSQSHCNFKSHVKSSCHSLIPSLPLLHLLRLPPPELDPILSTTVLYSIVLCPIFWLCPLISPGHGPHGKHCFLLSRMRVYWSVTKQWCPIIEHVCFAGMCLSTCCLAIFTSQYYCNVKESWKCIIQTESWREKGNKKTLTKWLKTIVTMYVPYFPAYPGECWDSTLK
jgi:hypothetical protein